MKKIIKISLLNILLIITILGICEFLIYKYNVGVKTRENIPQTNINEFTYKTYFPTYMTDLENFFDGREGFSGRKPDGIEYKNKKPIVLFGCSYAYGQYLDTNQTLSYKLAQKLKQPVYNRGIIGGSLSHLYMQATNESLYKTIPDTDTILYIFIYDQARRIFLNYFDVLDKHVLPHYSVKNGELLSNNYNNKFLNFFNALYTVKEINHLYADFYLGDKKNAEKIANLVTLYFVESKKELEKKWNKKLNFHILLYEDWPIFYGDLLKEKLEKNGFVVTSTNELTDEDLASKKYLMQDNHHPTEAAWDLLTPKIIEKFGL